MLNLIKNPSLKLLAAASAAALLTACASVASAEKPIGKTVTLDSDELVAIAFIDAKHDSRNVFFNDYFPSVLPAIQDAGGRVIAKFETIDVEEGDVTPQHVLLLQYPNEAAFNRAATDPRSVANAKVRSDALRDFKIGFFNIPEDVTLNLQDEVVYEFFAGTPAGPQTPEQLQTFFQAVIPTAMTYGRADALQLTPVQMERNSYFRPIAGLATWPTAAHFEQFTNTDVFRENVKTYRNPAFGELELINTYFVE